MLQHQKTPQITVLLPVLNGEPFLDTAVSSILRQTFTDFEFIILVDDASGDRTLDIAQNWAEQDARVQVVVNPHGRIGAAINFGFARAQGSYIALMEADDIALPHRFATQYAYLQENPVDLCGSCAMIFTAEDEDLYWFAETHPAINIDLFFRCAIHPSTVMMKRTVLEQHPYDPDALFQDYDHWTRIIHHVRMTNLPQILAKIRSHPQQVQRTKKASLAEADEAIKTAHMEAVFPHYRQEEKTTLLRILRKHLPRTTAELTFFGEWLLGCADQIEEAAMIRMLADRWYKTCLQSALLGPSILPLYNQIAAQFTYPINRDPAQLEAACLKAERGEGG